MPLKVRSYHQAYQVAINPAHVELPSKAVGAVLGTQHFEHLHNMSIDLMAPEDHDERLGEELAVALVVF